MLVTTELRPGGAEKCLARLACGLNKERFRTMVVSIASRPRGSQAKLVEQLEDQKIPIRFLNCDSKWSLWSAIRQLKQIVGEFQADIVQSFLIHANVVAGLALRRLPKIDFYSGIRVADPSRLRHRIEKWATKGGRKMICVSESVKEFAAQKMGFPPDKLIAIPNSIDQPQLTSSLKLSLERIEKPFVVFVGRLEPQKGLHAFFQALSKYNDKLPAFDLVLIGSGSELDSLQSATQSMQRNIHWLGWKDNPLDYLAQSAVKILPSKWEGMPNVLLEAMSLGKPFVAFGVDGVTELCPPGSVQLIQPDNYQKFFESLAQLVTDKEFAKEIGEKNRLHVLENFSTKKMLAKYEAVYLGDPASPV